MIINTKFDIGQKVWFRHDANTIFSSTIEAIATDSDKNGKTTIEYWSAPTISFHQSIFDECDVFATINEAENANNANVNNKSSNLFDELCSIISPNNK